LRCSISIATYSSTLNRRFFGGGASAGAHAAKSFKDALGRNLWGIVTRVRRLAYGLLRRSGGRFGGGGRHARESFKRALCLSVRMSPATLAPSPVAASGA
jgi:hypothetical protein